MTTEELAKQSIPESVLHPRARFLAYRGSIVQGLYEGGPDSDFDLVGFFPATASQYIGLVREPELSFEAKDGKWDAIYYEIRHLIQLLAKGNPDAMQMLWTPRVWSPVRSEASMFLRENRMVFATKQVYHSFTGFARGQVERMTRFDEKKAGAERAELFRRFGYDTKNAMHTIRTLRMAIEFLRTRQLVLDRRDAGDAAELLSIKHGDWSHASVKIAIDGLLVNARDAHAESTLPETTDLDAADQICRALVRSTVVLL